MAAIPLLLYPDKNRGGLRPENRNVADLRGRNTYAMVDGLLFEGGHPQALKHG